MIRRRRRVENKDAPGEDSFLDIVANLVGVLIILVVVVGANAGSKIRAIAISEVDRAELDQLQQEYKTAARHATSLHHDNHDLENRVLVEQRLADLRESERNQLLIDVQMMRDRLDQRKQDLTDEQQAVLDQSDLLATLQDRWRTLDSQFTSLKNVSTTNETIDHYPTPIAKTVFSDEIHFRIRGGKLVHVPMNELVDRMRNEWQEKARKLEVADETIETVGPVADFRLQYHLQAEERRVTTPYGDTTERVTSFTRFILVPVNEDIGETMDIALEDHSAFRNWIDLQPPQKTTVSVWVYPDSFGEFNQLKKWLYERGFKTACWPLSAHNPISGGPSGYRSSAQ
ncbi:MAG: hypothetical protein ACR2NP_13845 [Pirellulaceae bacterium]